jgi:hypothetical protein
MIESSLAVPTFVQYLQTLQYWVSPSELTISLAWHFGHIFSRFVINPLGFPFLKPQDSDVQKLKDQEDTLTAHREPYRILLGIENN